MNGETLLPPISTYSRLSDTAAHSGPLDNARMIRWLFTTTGITAALRLPRSFHDASVDIEEQIDSIVEAEFEI